MKPIPRSIWALGFVSLFMDTSSEFIHSLVPLFLVTTLGASVMWVGFIEGVAESLALIVKVFSGTLSDYLRKRKLLTVIGYGLAAFSKPLFPLASTISMVMTARFLDRIGKGIRGAPRDALIGDLAPAEIRGACFGLRQSLDTVGAVLGPAFAMVAMLLFHDQIRTVLWWAVLPAFIAMAILIMGVQEPSTPPAPANPQERFHVRDITRVGSAYWHVVIIAFVLTLARFSEAFLLLKAQTLHVPLALIPLVMVAMNVVYALCAYPVGILSDRISRDTLLWIGILFLIAADIVLAFAQNWMMLSLGVCLWGVHMGLTQGILATLVTDHSPPALRGTAFGVFNLVSGVAMLMASVLAGVLWTYHGPQATFLAGAMISLCSMGLWKMLSANAASP